jgi:hypothetical protein
MPRNLKIVLVILGAAVLVGLISLHGLNQRVEQFAETKVSDEQARHELLAQPISTSSDTKVKANIFWAAGADKTSPVEMDLELSLNPTQRAKQVLHSLVTDPPTPEQRTLPADATLLGFYILSDGTAIADFSQSLASETPSGILSEEVAVNSIVQTLQSNVSSLRRLKILIHGQEVDTLAGHVDLTGFFDLTPPTPPATAAAGAISAPAGASSSANPTGKSAPPPAPR